MLRITPQNECASVLTLKVEGRLIGPWVEVLRDCWQQQLSEASGLVIQIDLRGVTSVDAAGIGLLTEMFGQNAQLIGGDCKMKAILAEIARPLPLSNPFISGKE